MARCSLSVSTGYFFFNEWDKIVQQVFFKIGKSLYFIRRHYIAGGAVVFHGSSIGHYYYHWCNPAFPIQVIEDHLWFSAFQPFLLIAAYTMQQV